MEIAVIGMGCHFPGADSPRHLFENVLAGRRQFRLIPPGRWRSEDYYDPSRNVPDKTYCRKAALLTGFDFNAPEFRIPQSTLRATDVAQWLALGVSQEAIRDTGIQQLPGSTTAVVLGNTLTGEISRANGLRLRWPYVSRVVSELLEELGVPREQHAQILHRVETRYKEPFPEVNEDNLAGSLANTIAGRICNYFDFHGGGFTVDGACSSSLLAIQQACVGLERGQFDLALAGGVDVSLDPFEIVGFAKVGALSDSDIRVYDQRSNGFLPGEGCGVVVLERLTDAIRAGRRIYAVVRGTGCSSDGKGGITAPSVIGQSLALGRAYEQAGYTFADVDLIEGHGTGTPVGDRTELLTFIEAKRRYGATPEHRCGLGSVKSIVGHTKAAAGVAGFMKAALSLYHGILPPTMGVEVANNLFKSTSHLYPLTRGRRWRAKRPLRAAVSSAGFGGINTHVTLEQFGGATPQTDTDFDVDLLLQTHQDAEVFFFSAADSAQLRNQLRSLSAAAGQISHAELVDVAAYCAHTEQSGCIRLAVVAQTPEELRDRLAWAEERLEASGGARLPAGMIVGEGVYLAQPRRAPRIAFLFPGQGSQRVNMGLRWRQRFAPIERHWQECNSAVETVLRLSLSDHVHPADYVEALAERTRWAAALKDTRIAQPATVAASMATSDVLAHMGIEPDVLIGHSLGEYTALWKAGVLDRDRTVELTAMRGAIMAHAAEERSGAMVSVAAGPMEVAALLKLIEGYAEIANLNGPNQTVVSGETQALQALSELCLARGCSCTTLEVSGAFHSRLMEPAANEMAKVLGATVFRSANKLIISSVSAQPVTASTDVAELLTRQIVAPVRFADALSVAERAGVDIYVDVGPSAVMSGLARRVLGVDPATTHRHILTTEGGSESDWGAWCNCLACLFASGASLVPRKVFEGRFYRRFGLPYEPKFITSPCEAPHSPLRLRATDQGRLKASELNLESTADEGVSRSPASVAKHGMDAQGILEFMRELISLRFGYPDDMIAPQTRLAEDLGLDSIKAVEVIAQALGHARSRSDPSRFVGMRLAEIAAAISQAPPEALQELPAAEAEWVRAFEVQMHLCALAGSSLTFSGTEVIIIDPDGSEIRDSLVRQLKALGLHGVVVSNPFAPFKRIKGDLAGCILVCPADVEPSPLMLEEHELDSRLYELPRLLLSSTKAVLRAGLGRGETSFFALVTRSDGFGGRGELPKGWCQAPAAAAFVKSFHLENPQIITRLVDVDTRLMAATAAERILDEVTCGEAFQEAGYTMSGLRYVPLLGPISRTTLSDVGPLPHDSDVIVATGGAKGITARCLEAVAAGRRARWALLGSSPAPNPGEDHEIARSLAKLAEQGIPARYYCCDVNDPRQVASCVAAVAADLGPITGILHGAGLNVPHRLEALEWGPMQRVLSPKMAGLLNLIRAVDAARLRHVTLLSSIIGFSGMAGNADYAFANAWATQLLQLLEAHYPQVTCRAFAFSIWDEIGMGMRLNSVGSLARLGVRAIKPEEGAQWFAGLMQRLWPGVELAVVGPLGELATARFLGPPSVKSRWLEKLLVFRPGVEAVAEVRLRLDTDPYLKDHNYDGLWLFPAVAGMEAMAQVAAACADSLDIGNIPPRLEALRFERPIVVPAEGRTIYIRTFVDEPTAAGIVRVKVSIESDINGNRTECFSGCCIWGTTTRAWESARPVASNALPIDPHELLYGSLYFQGPTFQHIAAFHEVSEHHCVARVRVSRPSPEAVPPGSLLLDRWEIRDCFLHAIQICVPQLRLLPVSIESLETRGFAQGDIYLCASERLKEGRDYVYDIDVLDEAGRVIECITGYRCRAVDQFRKEEVLQYVRAIHALANRTASTPVGVAAEGQV